MMQVLPWMLVGSLAVLLASAAWLMFPRAKRTEARKTWVLTREGMVRFHGEHILHVRWADAARIEIQVEHAMLFLKPGAVPVQHRLAAGELQSPQVCYQIEQHEVEDSLSAFVQQATLTLHDGQRSSLFPTFTQPEGPPQAVLADLQPWQATLVPPSPPQALSAPPPVRTGQSASRFSAEPREASEVAKTRSLGKTVSFNEGTPMFKRDLKTLCDGLDPTAYAEELKLLASCGAVDDLEWLAANDSGWLTKHRRNPKIKLVRHGTGTFLVVKYDDGWSSTLSKAPFQS